MNKKISTILGFLIITSMFFVSCSVINTSLNSAPPPQMPEFSTVVEFHDHLIIATSDSSSGISPINYGVNDITQSGTSANKQYYYIPSWLPEDFTLDFITYSSWTITYIFTTVEYSDNPSSHEHILNNRIDFVWYSRANAAEGLNEVIEVHDLNLVEEITGLYYYDYAASNNLDVNLKRCYYWIQDDYLFHLGIPLRTFNNINGNLDEVTVNQLIMNSALKVEFVEDEFFEPPTSLELNEIEAELDISETILLTAEVTPDNATIDDVYWNTSDNRVATVDQGGLVTRVGPGSATITATTVANGLTATFELKGDPTDYEVTGISANEITNAGSKDIEVTVTFRNNMPVEGYVPIELLYSGVVYLSEDIYFNGTAGQTITKMYLIENLFPVDRCQIMARINYEYKYTEENPDNNSLPMAPKYVPVPHNDYAIIFMKVYQEDDQLHIDIAIQNRSYEDDAITLLILYGDEVFHDGPVFFKGIPYEVVLLSVTGPAGTPSQNKPVEAFINWWNRESEDNPDNNRMLYILNIE